MNSLEFKPDYAVRPGETIKETLDAKSQTLSDLAKATGETLDYLTDVVEARTPITEELAGKFEAFLGVPKQFWLNLQDNYDSTIYRLFWERVRKKPNLFAHLTDGQIEALEALLQSVDENYMPSREEEVEFYKDIDFVAEQLTEEYRNRFFKGLEG